MSETQTMDLARQVEPQLPRPGSATKETVGEALSLAGNEQLMPWNYPRYFRPGRRPPQEPNEQEEFAALVEDAVLQWMKENPF